MSLTPVQLRIHYAKNNNFDLFSNNSNINASNSDNINDDVIKKELVFDSLKNDVNLILEYRNNKSDPINYNTFKKWFPSIDDDLIVFNWLDTDRDFIYTHYGLSLLIDRYLLKQEPLQYCMLRISKLFAKTKDELHMYYDLVSCGFLHVSSIFASSHLINDEDEKNEIVRRGEACRLYVASNKYDKDFIKQISNICLLNTLGVGIGFGVSNVPLIGNDGIGDIKSGFKGLAYKLNSCGYFYLHNRKPKFALYLHVHCDTIYEAFETKHINKEPLFNIFYGLLIPDYFMQCVRNDNDWYLFPSNLTLENGKNLSDFYGDEYVEWYKKCVEAKLYTQKYKARKIMLDIIDCLKSNGIPYIIWSDNVNRYNNQKELGVIKTLNLCAEITNYSNAERSSSCTLMSVNFGMINEYWNILNERWMKSIPNDIFECYPIEYHRHAKLAYLLGYHGVWALNNFMDDQRKYREIAVNPLGVYDSAIIDNLNPVTVCGYVSEMLYYGAIKSSCDYYQKYNIKCYNYKCSPFSYGQTQFHLRKIEPKNPHWLELCEMMKNGMANSMLTAQAPTASTALLTGVTESVTLPIDERVTRESLLGRHGSITYGLMYTTLNNQNVKLINDIDSQLEMYKVSLPYIDHSQSTMFSIELDSAKIYNLIIKTWLMGFKTAIYYILGKQKNKSITTVRNIDLCNINCDSCTL